MQRRASRLALPLLFALGGLISCSGSGPTVSPRTALAAAKQRLDSTSGVHFALKADPVASGTALERAEGDAAPPSSFTGTATIHTGGITATIKVISVAGTVFVVEPFSSTFTKVDPAKYGLVDPGALLSPQSGISTYLTADAGARADGSTRVGGEVLDRYRATLPEVSVLSSDAKDVPAEFDLVARTHELRRVVLQGHLFDAGTSTTLTLTLTKYGQRVDIRAP